jgi:hypothetical protein
MMKCNGEPASDSIERTATGKARRVIDKRPKAKEAGVSAFDKNFHYWSIPRD